MSHDVIASVGARDLEPLNEVLVRFVRDAGVLCAMVVDRTGRLLTLAGDPLGMDQTTLASVAAADFAASDQLAQLLGETEFTALYHNGTRRSMYLADLAGWAILAVMFDARTTLGLVRIRARPVVPTLTELLTRMSQRARSGQVEGAIELDWVSEAEDSIDRLFAE